MSEMTETIVDTTKVSDKGQIVIPKEVRDKMNIKVGSKFLVIATEDAIILQKVELVKERMKIRLLIEKAKAITERLTAGR